VNRANSRNITCPDGKSCSWVIGHRRANRRRGSTEGEDAAEAAIEKELRNAESARDAEK
jgi:hypothetical protein